MKRSTVILVGAGTEAWSGSALEPHLSSLCLGSRRHVRTEGGQIHRCGGCGGTHLVPDSAELGSGVCRLVRQASETAKQLHRLCQQPLQLQTGLGHLLLWGRPR